VTAKIIAKSLGPRGETGSLRPVPFLLLSRCFAVSVAAVGFFALLGWVFDIPAMKSLVQGFATVKMNTALCLLLSGASLASASFTSVFKAGAMIGRALALPVLMIAAVSLGEGLFGWNAGIDQYLVYDPASNGRMALATAINLSLVGIALLTLQIEVGPGFRPSQWIGLLVCILSCLALLGYIFGVRSLYAVNLYSSMAIQTATGLFLLGVGIVFVAPESGIMIPLSADSLGGVLARRLLPWVIAIPVFVGWVRWQGQRAGYYGTEFGLALFATANMTLLAAVSWWLAARLHAVDLDRRRANAATLDLNDSLEQRVRERTAALTAANEALRLSEEKFRAVAETAKEAFISVDQSGNIVFWNQGAERAFGAASETMLGEPLASIIPMYSDFLRGRAGDPVSDLQAFMGSGIALHGKRADGFEFPIEVSLSEWRTEEGRFLTAIIRNITDRKTAEQALKRQAADLARSNGELEQFAYVASHDLQEPLRSMASYAQLLARRYEGKIDADADNFIHEIVDGATRLKRLIQELLEYGRIGSRCGQFTEVSLEVILGQTVANLRSAIESSRAQITFSNLPTVLADAPRIESLFQNLLDNAIKFRGKQAPKIHVFAERKAGKWQVAICDNGIGIEPQYNEKIFLVFQRLHGRTEFEGTGIGLAICKKIVERHGGKIWVESKPGEGSTFLFTLEGPQLPGPDTYQGSRELSIAAEVALSGKSDE
jgi:PAS domain S-box-containing protein